MDEDDIMSVALDLHDFLVDLGRVPNDDEDYEGIQELLMNKLAPFITKERNYN